MRKGLLAAALVVAVIAGAAAIAVPVIERHAADKIKARIESDGATQVESVEVGLFDRSVTLNNLRTTRLGKMSMQRWSASGLAWPLGELLQGRTPFTGWQLGDPIQAGRVVLTDLHIDVPAGQSIRIGNVVIEDLDLARFDGRADAGNYTFAILGARVTQALSLRRFQETDISVTPPGGASGFKISEISMNNVAAGKFGGFSIAGIEMEGSKPDEPTFKLERVTMSGLNIRRVLAAMSAANWRIGRPLGRVELDSGSMTGFGGEAFRRYGISLGGITTETVREGANVTRVHSRIDGFMISPPRSGLQSLQIRMAMTAMGLKQFRLDLDCAGTEDRGRGVLSMDRCALRSPDLAEIDLGFKLQDADDKFWDAVDSGDMTKVFSSKIALGSARLVLADKSLLERLFKAIAASSGQPAPLMRSSIAQQVRQYQPPGVLISEDMTKLLDTVARFVETGGTLTVELKPDPPFDMAKVGRLSTPGPDLIGLLGVTATLVPPG